MATTSPDFQQLIRPEHAGKYKEIAKFLFEDPDSPQEQSGLFKVISRVLVFYF
jgi:hypothetical protein